MTDKGISELESLGFKRWSKYGKDRLYVTDKALEKIADLKMVLRRKGSIQSATLDGDPISNSQAGKISAGMTGAYIDLNTMKVEYMPDSSHSASFYGVTTKVKNEIKKRIYPTQ